MVLVRNEANLLAIRLLGHLAEVEMVGDLADLLFAVASHRKLQPRHYLWPDSPQHVRLVLARIEPLREGQSAIGCRNQPGVMTRGDLPGPDALGVLQQLAEFQPRVANHAGIGRAAGSVLGDEVTDNPIEFPLKINCIEGNFQSLGDAPCIGRITGATAALFPRCPSRRSAGRQFLMPMAHKEADHIVARLAEQPGSHAAIDSARHGQNNACHVSILAGGSG